jgi:predicted nucleic acid-binding protein
MRLTIQPDDAFGYIVENLRRNPAHTGVYYDVSLPAIVWDYLVANGYSRNQQGEYQSDPDLEYLWRAFYDAAWWLCRMGIFRITASWAKNVGIGMPSPGNGYSITAAGRKWLQSTDLFFVPSEPTRYSELLYEEAKTLGPGLIARLPVIAFDLTVARVHASLWADLARRGIVVGERDLMIGATAIARDYDIVTRDERSFPKIPGLKVNQF